MCHKSGLLDPERTTEMAEDEQAIVQELQRIKMEVSNTHFSECPESPADGWVPKYVARMKPRIEDQVSWARGCVDRYKQSPTTRLRDEIHSLRRRIAVIHQDVYLTEQGINIPVLAVHLRESIPCGYRCVFVSLNALSCNLLTFMSSV